MICVEIDIKFSNWDTNIQIEYDFILILIFMAINITGVHITWI